MKPEYKALRDELIAERSKQYIRVFEGLPPLSSIVRAMCEEWSKKFAERFPELTVQKGFYNGAEHWWCVEPDGTIVDPTIEQFGVECGEPTHYRIFNPEVDEVYLGRCMNCGDEIYGLIERGRQCICSEECHSEYMAWESGELDDA